MSVETLNNFQIPACCGDQKPETDIKSRFLKGLTLLSLWAERNRSRRQLAGLSDHMLHDIGLTRADVTAEADKPFWVK
ncbi:MAG: DUF1127 domain-containing protein [Methylocystaceae bacterium]|nr:DUF1127 domain-containing protein [Methylocystaceae bacterium]